MEVTPGEIQTHYWQGSLHSHPQLILTPSSLTHLETKMAHGFGNGSWKSACTASPSLHQLNHQVTQGSKFTYLIANVFFLKETLQIGCLT